MDYLKQKGLPMDLGGHRIVSIKAPNKIPASDRAAWESFIDTNNSVFRESNKDYHLGLMSSWNMQTSTTYPTTIAETLKNDAEIEVNGFNGGFTFEKPFYDVQQGLKTVASSADQGVKIGQDQTEFVIYLSEKTYPNEILATDLYFNNHQLQVVNSEQSELSGNSWKTVVKLTDGNPEAYYPAHLLEPNVKYYRIDHKVSEYTTQFAGAENPFENGIRTIKARFELAGARGVEGYVTGFADAKKRFGNRTASYNDMPNLSINVNNQNVNNIDPGDLLLMAKPDGKGGLDKSTARATTFMEYAVEHTLMKRTATAHMWAAFGEFTDENGAIRYINEGLWHQLRRGKIIEYSRPGGITRYHIAQAVNYIYQNNPSLDWRLRKVKFKGGKNAIDNLTTLFQNEVQMQIQTLTSAAGSQFLFGDKGQLDKPLITGELDNLKLNLFQFAEIPIPGIAGSVSFEHDASLDFMPGQDFRTAGNNSRGMAWTSYSLIIWDVTDQSYTNNMYKLPNSDEAKVYNPDANVYLVRPEGNMVFKGRSNGRWDMGKASDIISSSKYIAQEFWAFNSSALWLRDPSKVVMIELAPEARLGSMHHLL